jgi:16S rRNA C967 or C1407 C5-methylase (RsmB/RsmF family)/NOL1/NOP2/fmu family ribosome biogenesis protein
MQTAPLAWPPAFLERMRALLGSELGPFLEALAQPRARGLRLNPGKVDARELAALLRLDLEPVPWCPSGYLLDRGPGLGAHPAHLAGLFYLQDPSAMCPVEVLDPEPGWKVVDLAAAPGGKTTHLLSRLGPDGLVVANDVAGRRLRLLHENLDRWGAGRVVTAALDFERLAELLPGSFDAALLDAPCSGEALLRRDPAFAAQWSPATVAGSARRQHRLLSLAGRLVRPGGTLLYSTCTFEIEENEQQVADLLAEQPGWELAEIAHRPGFEPGVALHPWPTERTVRLWPQKVPGDGQFIARLRRRADLASEPRSTRTGSSRQRQPGRRPAARDVQGERRLIAQWSDFCAQAAPGLELPGGRLVARGAHLYHVPSAADELFPATELLARAGTPLGMGRPALFQPSQALACLLGPGQVARSVSWSAGDERLAAFLRGETVDSSGEEGWVLVCYERWGIGWGRVSGGVIKNFLPHHLRTRGVQAAGAGREL